MKCDGNAIQFNANNFFYGDIEGKGTYRVELFVIYGWCGGWQSVEQCFQQFLEYVESSNPTSTIVWSITYTVFY